ncbi:MAG TPA: phosphoribosylglycinamide synthetase C domain-containing protein, partial [Acidimicrobiia bacterium]|nr:phosphoribosylglycinamide synthetase C domain-containing protein [Acidimicrobiia bacterium]
LESAEGALRTEVSWRPEACVSVVLAAEGYPASPRTGDPIEGLHEAGSIDDVMVFHAGTRVDGDKIVTAGGRVLNVTALGDTVPAARDRAYEAVGLISWRGMQHRSDIAMGVR